MDSAQREALQGVRFAAWGPPFEFCKYRAQFAREASAFLQHYFRGLDHRRNGIAYLEFHFLGASLRDYTFDHIFANADRHVSHNAIHFKLDNLPFDTVPC
jgi:hypothetical protein